MKTLPKKPRATKRRGRHPDKALSAAFCRTVARAGRYADGNGLYLHVDPSGARRWVQRLVIRGRSRGLGLGSYALVSLAEARELALANRKLARAGGDPLAAKRRTEGMPSFEEASEKVVAIHSGGWKDGGKSAKQWRASLSEYAYRRIGDKGVDQGYRSDNPAGEAIAAALPKRPVKVRHMPALPYREVSGAIAAVHASRGWSGAKLAFEFQVLTAARSAEVRLATWDEFDLGALMWTIPDTRMKAQREHRVPLCGRAVEILREAGRLSPAAAGDEPAGVVFPSRRGMALSEGGISKLVKLLGISAVPHGFRSSFRDWAAEQTNHPREVIEAALAHVVQNKVEAAYARSDLFERRRILMDDWAAYLGEERGQAVALRR